MGRWSMSRAACGPGSTPAGACGRYDQAGKLIKTVRLPTANVTKMCFGGPDLKTAYATTARKNLDAAALAMQPDAGNLFMFDPGVAGVPVTPAKITGLGK
jgi:sugar lactone lactonase YvrE